MNSMDIKRKYTFGPVCSRRLGISLGVDIIPRKLCTLDCVYCEVGATDKRGIIRKEYYPVKDIVAEVKAVLSDYANIDNITISGSGEPTLNVNIGDIINEIKQITNIPMAVLTNGTLLFKPDVRKDLLSADIVSPSLDAVTQEIFEKINRPHPDLKIADIIEGIKTFRKEYRGKLWLEILFVEGFNDDEKEILRMKNVIGEIKPDKIHLNTVVRPPAYSLAKPVSEQRLVEIRNIFGEGCEIIGMVNKEQKTEEHQINIHTIFELLKRRAMTIDEITLSLGLKSGEVNESLEKLECDKAIKSYVFNGKKFFQVI